MKRCPKCLIVEGSIGAQNCQLSRCPRVMEDFTSSPMMRAPEGKGGRPKKGTGTETAMKLKSIRKQAASLHPNERLLWDQTLGRMIVVSKVRA